MRSEEPHIPPGWIVANPAECVAALAAFIREYRLTDVISRAMPPALRPDQMNLHPERYATGLVPRLKAMSAG